MSTYAIVDSFSDSRGRWDEPQPLDSSEQFNSVEGFLTTQEHVDIRSFRVFSDLVAVPQSVLDAEVQSILDAEPQSAMELMPGTSLSENWQLALGSTGVDALFVGELETYGGWSGLQLTTTGTAINATITSSIQQDKIDISNETDVTIILPDYNSFDGDSYIQFTSDTNGIFGNGYDSAQVAFSSNISSMPQFAFAISSLTNSGFDNTQINGVKIVLLKATPPVPDQTITFLALRAVSSSWQVAASDFDTRWHLVQVPVTLSGEANDSAVAQDFQYLVGDGSASDPIPVDGSYTLYFYPGGATSPNDATGSTYNKIGVLMREVKTTALSSGSLIYAALRFNDTHTYFDTQRIDTTGTSGGTTPGSQTYTTLHEVEVGDALNPDNFYAFNVTLVGQTMGAELITVDRDFNQLDTVWTLSPISSNDFTYRNGRVGFISNLISRDAFLMSYNEAATGFARLQTQVYTTRTPVDGVQLQAVYSPDANLYTSSSGNIFIDQTKTVSGLGSIRTTTGITTNQFISDDWTQMYLNVTIWVGNSSNASNTPQIVLNLPDSTQNLEVPILKPSQWNYLYFTLSPFQNLLTGIGYSFSFLPSLSHVPLGYFWIDSIIIGKRKVAWSARATPNGQFRQFWDMTNNSLGAVHFIIPERGNQLQLRADALTDDAWISSFSLFPRYAQLGFPIYDISDDVVDPIGYPIIIPGGYGEGIYGAGPYGG